MGLDSIFKRAGAPKAPESKGDPKAEVSKVFTDLEADFSPEEAQQAIAGLFAEPAFGNLSPASNELVKRLEHIKKAHGHEAVMSAVVGIGKDRNLVS